MFKNCNSTSLHIIGCCFTVAI
uniref:Uncharacterized protein n=1 Tax=Lepeophtheirus salmonis TaxID=72036 RepID=A0A0K2U8Z3_LEPSM